MVADASPNRDAEESPTPVRMRLGAQIALWLGLAVLVTIGVGALLWWGLGSPAITGPAALKPEYKFDLIKIALSVTGGIGGVIFLVIAYRKQHLGEAAEQRENARERREDVKLFNERFNSATQQLGSDAAAVRLAGVYAMAGLADDWEAGRQTCIDVLCAYLRMRYDPALPEDPDELRGWHGERQVRQTVVRVITAHLRAGATVSWQGHDFDFSGAVFDGADFTRVRISGGEVNFDDAQFVGGVIDFSDAEFSGGTVNFRRAGFSGGTVNFRFVVFSGARMDFWLARFSGSKVDFYLAKFLGSVVSFLHTGFADGEVDFVGAEFSGGEVHLEHAQFSGGRVDLRAPRSWTVPPYLRVPWADHPPPGLLLPGTTADEDLD